MGQSLILKCKGLHTAPNEFSAVPEGALLKADNCSADTDNILEPRRGNLREIAFSSGSDRSRRYAFYQSKKIAAYTGGKVAYDNAGTWSDYTGTFNDPDSALGRIKFLLAATNLYFTSAVGVQRLDAYNGTPILSGIPKGLDMQLTLPTATGATFATGNQWAYRVVWGFRDANNNLLLSAPSGRAVITNNTGSTKDCTVRLTIPSSITTSYFFQVYRSAVSGSATTEPDDELGLVYEANPSATDITNKYVEFTDVTPDSLRGATLYTSPSQQGILQSNERCPLAKDLAFFQGSTFYANCTSKYRKNLTVLAVGGTSGIAVDDTLTIGGIVFTAKGTETIASGFYQLVIDTTTTGNTNTNTTISGVASFNHVKVGRSISGTDIPANTKIAAFDTGAGTITLSQAATGTSVGVTLTISGTAAQNIADTVESLIRVINRYSSNTATYATLLSGVNDLPGKIVLEERGLGGSSFSLTVSARGNAFNPVLPIAKSFVDGDVTVGTDTIAEASHGFFTGQSVVLTTTGTLPAGLALATTYYIIFVDANNYKLASSSINASAGTAVNITAAAGGGTHTTTPTNIAATNDNYQHQVFYSKTDQPEAVPLLNYKFVGSANSPIRRILPLGNSLFVLKEEGIFRITGNSPQTFEPELFDVSARILAPESADVVNNQIWFLSDQGVTLVTETGASIVSRPIEDKILGPTGTALTQIKQYSVGVGYETDRKYILWTVETSADTFATQAFVWNTFTRAFTRWAVPATAAGVNPADGKLYIGAGGSQHTLQERKTLTYADYVDYSVSVSIASFSGKAVTLNTITDVEVGDILSQGAFSSIIESIAGLVVTVADTIGGWTVASASVLKSYESTAEWAAVTAGNPGVMKQWPEVAFLFRSARFNTAYAGFSTDASGSFEEVTMPGSRVGLWGLFPWGQAPWGAMPTAIPIRVETPLEKQRSSLLRLRFRIRQGYSAWKLNGLSIPYRDTGSYYIGG